MKKLILISTLFLATGFLLESCVKPACGSKSSKKKKARSLKNNDAFKM